MSKALKIPRLYRDQLMHKRGIDGLSPMRVDVPNTSKRYEDLPDIQPLTMPDGTPAVAYVGNLAQRTRQYVRKSLLLLPRIDSSHLSFPDSYDGIN